MIRSKIYYVHSDEDNRQSGNSNDFSYEMNLNDAEGYDYCTVLSASIPVSYYLIQDRFNTFNLIEQSIPRLITVPIGNYSAQAFATLIKNLLNSNTQYNNTYNVTLDATKGLFNFTVTLNNPLHSQPAIQIISANMYRRFGFDKSSINYFVANALSSSNVIDFIPISTLYIVSDIISTQESAQILQEIVASNVIPFSTIVFQNRSPLEYGKKMSTSIHGLFRFSITDINGITINLNGQSMSMTLLLYKKDDISQLTKQYIKYRLSSE